jgi:glycine cleavage system H protein
MSNLPNNLKYANSHEWAQIEDGQIIRVGITDFAQEQLGDLVYIELPELGRQVSAGEQCAVVESVKTASDLYSPVTGEVVAINENTINEPEQVNDNPYQAWLFKIRAADLSGYERLMGAAAYQHMIEQ